MSTLAADARMILWGPAGMPAGSPLFGQVDREYASVPAGYVSIEDAADIRASLDGDGQAYARIVRRYQGEIGRYLWRFARGAGECEELTQDVFVEAWFSLRSYRGRAAFSHWLRRIATRVVYRRWKQQRAARPDRRLQAAASALAAGQAGPPPDPGQARDAVQAMLARLGPRDRLVLTLMYLEERTPREIAALTGWSVTMVKVQAHRARGRLRRLLHAGEDVT